MNKVHILGTMTRDCELKYTQSGSAIGSFGIAYNDRWKSQDGQPKEKAHFFDCTAFGKTAENISKYFHKGSRILIDGSLDFQTWQTQDGSTRTKVGIKVNGFDFIDRKQDAQQGQAPQGQQYQPQGQPQGQTPQGYATGGGMNNPSPQQQGAYNAQTEVPVQHHQHQNQNTMPQPLPVMDAESEQIPF